jgi:hypothetical protein
LWKGKHEVEGYNWKPSFKEDNKMAFPTSVNNQITDAVSQSGVNVLSDAPAMAMGSLYQAAAQATGIAFQNAVASQQNMNTAAQAATSAGVKSLLEL